MAKRKATKQMIEPEHKGPNKRDGMPFYGESVVNFVLKVALGALVFWLLFYPVYLASPDMDFLTQVSYILLFSLAGSITAMILAYFLVSIMLSLLKRPKKGLFDLNKFPDMASILYELLAVMLNALLMASGLIWFLDQQAPTWEQFFLLYLVMKIVSRMVAFVMAQFMGKSLLFTIGFLFAFFAIISVAVAQLTGVAFFAK